MSMMPDRRATLALALAAAGLAAPGVRAQTAAWRPTRPVRLIVPFAPGGSNDIVGRLIAEPAGALLGQPVVVENRAGAGSMVGAEAAARAPADGYTLLINSAQSTVPAIVASVPYNSVDDFVGIAVAGFSPYVLAVNPGLPAQTAQELVALLKANPGRYNFASAGLGSGVHVGGELFRAMTGTQFEIVHYRGGGPGVAAILSNEAQFGLPTMASSIGQVRQGGVRALAVAAAQRSPALPNVPSAPQAGLPNLIHEENFPILAPKGTPPEVVAALSAAFRAAIQRIAPRLIELAGVAPREGYDTSAKVMELVREGVALNTRVLRQAGVQPQ
jgi:tripartite-type tricarboxylate transporter receptor subunit TctC